MTLPLLLAGVSAASAAQATMPAVQVVIAGVGDVSDDFHQVVTVRGRNRELDEFQAGTAQVTLLDRARKYDPSNTASPYYPKIRPMAGVQLLATWDGTTYPLFTGTVDSVESVYAGPPDGDAETTLYLTDGFKALAAADLASSSYYQEVQADGPVNWWHLGDAADAGRLFDAIGGAHLTTIDPEIELDQDGLISREPDGAITIPAGGSGYAGARGNTPPAITSRPLSIELVYRGTPHPIGAGDLLGWRGSGPSPFVQVLEFGGRIHIGITSNDGTVDSLRTVSTALFDGQTHHFVFTWDTDTTGHLYLDGVEVANEGGGPDDGTLSGNGDLTGATLMHIGAATAGIDTGALATLDEVALYDHVLTPARVAAHAEARATPWNNDSPGERIGRALDAVDWPAERRDLDTGTVVLQPAELGGTALEHAQKAAASDFGALFISAAGDVTFIGREELFNRPQLYTFGDGPGELGYVSLRPELTDQLIANDITVSRLEGTAQRVTDETSIATYLRHSLVLDGLLFDDDTFALAAAQFLLSERKDPVRRVSNLIVRPRGAPTTLFPPVLALELLDQITVIDRPPGGGSPNTQDTSVEGISHTITPLGWETSWNLAPSLGAQGTPGVVWQLGVPGYSELGVTTRLAF